MAENTEMMKDLVNVEPLHLIDVCSEDDCLISTPGFGEDNQNEDDCFDLFVVGDAEERGEGKDDCFDLSEIGDPNTRDDEDGQGQMDQKETGGRPRKNGKCNLRKSLAWDSAFFTNDGVLDAEELSFISNGMRKAPSTLPGIQEDVRRSAESSSTFNSTLDGDSLTRESFEVVFFEDVRASIQRSSKLPNVANANSKVIPGVPAPKKAELAGRNKMKPVVASKRQSVNTKEAVVRPRVTQLAARSGEPTSSSLKPPKIAVRANPISAALTKKTTFAPTRVKIDNNTQKTASVTGKGQTAAVLKKPSLLRSSVTSRLAPIPKSSSDFPSTTKMKPSASCSSFTTSGSTSSDSTAKSPLKSLRSKPDSKNVAPVSKPTLKNPLRISSKARTDPENSRLTAYLNSIPKPKLPSNTSPSSSIDGWSTESSSSTSTLTKANVGISTPHRGSTNIGVNSPRGGSTNAVGSRPRVGSANVGHNTPRKGPTNVGVDSPRKISSLRRESHASQASNVEVPPPYDKSSLNQGTKKASVVSASVSNTASANGSKACKPSGLRMPSPKIGFFDAEKSLVSTPLGGSQSRSSTRSGFTGSGESGPVTPSEELVKTKVSKLQEGRSVKPAGSIKLDSVVPSVSSKKYASSEQLQELSLHSPKFPDASAKLQDTCDTALKVQKHPSSGTPKTEHRKSLDAGDLPNIIPVDQGSVANEEKIDIQYSSKNSIGVASDVIVPSGDEETKVSEESFVCSMTASKKSGEMPLDEQGHARDSSDLLQKSNEKENLSCTDDQVGDLIKQVAAVDLNVGVIKEPVGKKDTHNEHDLGDPVVVSSNTCTLLDHDQEELEKISAKLNHLCLSPNTVEILYSTRAPLADNISFCNKSEPLESESESTVDASQSIVVAPDTQN